MVSTRSKWCRSLPVIIADDIESCADVLRPMLALYIGGMGAKGANFHYEVFARMGYEAECARIQDLYLDGHKADAIAAVPTALVEDVALIGPLGKVDPRSDAVGGHCHLHRPHHRPAISLRDHPGAAVMSTDRQSPQDPDLPHRPRPRRSPRPSHSSHGWPPLSEPPA